MSKMSENDERCEDYLQWANFIVIGVFSVIIVFNIQALGRKEYRKNPFIFTTLLGLLVSLLSKLCFKI